MEFYGASDLDTMFAEFGVPVELDGQTVNMIRSVQDRERITANDGSLIGKEISLLMITGSLPGVGEKVEIKVEGVRHRITGVLQGEQSPFDDGATTLLYCIKV